jgi:predicted ATPase
MSQPQIPAILALISAPLIDLHEGELGSLETWLGGAGRAIELHVQWAETARLQRALLGRPFGGLRASCFDLLHYTGHGNPQTLAFEDGRGGLQALSAEQLAALVCPGGEPAFRLAFLSACHSEGLAGALLMAGVPHVVAVDKEKPVLDLAAAAFARAFYAALLAGRTVAAAFDQGLTAVRTDADLYRVAQKLKRPALAEGEAAKFRLLPERSDDHAAALFAPGLPAGPVTRVAPTASSHTLGARPETFTGRQRELHELIGHILDNRLTALIGMGGMGKTELAKEAGRWLAARGHFSDGVVWVDLRNVTDPAILRARIARAAGLRAEIADADLAAALAGKERLLILDDLDEAARHGLPGLRRLLAALYHSGGPHLLLTTRERLGRHPPTKCQNLGQLSPDEARRLFWQELRRAEVELTGDPAHLEDVLRFLGGWPLALVLAAPLLKDYSLAELHRRLQEEKELLLNDPHLPPEAVDKLDSVDFSLSLSYDHLQRTQPEAARVFSLLALFPGGADEGAIKAVLGPEALTAAARLRAASLVEQVDGSRIRLPGPARAYAGRRLSPYEPGPVRPLSP